jgi:hypothetical protein
VTIVAQHPEEKEDNINRADDERVTPNGFNRPILMTRKNKMMKTRSLATGRISVSKAQRIPDNRSCFQVGASVKDVIT